MAIKVVLFDLDGTLIDSSEGITKSAQYALAHYGIHEPDLDKLKAFIGPPLAQSFVHFYGFTEAQGQEAVLVYRERYHAIGVYECSLYPGVKECLQKLKAQGYLIGMASSKPEVSCRQILEHFGIIDLFDHVVGATLDGKIGTKEEVLREAFRRMPSIKASEMILIGDTIFDIDGANSVGMPSMAVSFGFGHVEEMMDAGAKALCNHMKELPDILKNYNS